MRTQQSTYSTIRFQNSLRQYRPLNSPSRQLQTKKYLPIKRINQLIYGGKTCHKCSRQSSQSSHSLREHSLNHEPIRHNRPQFHQINEQSLSRHCQKKSTTQNNRFNGNHYKDNRDNSIRKQIYNRYQVRRQRSRQKKTIKTFAKQLYHSQRNISKKQYNNTKQNSKTISQQKQSFQNQNNMDQVLQQNYSKQHKNQQQNSQLSIKRIDDFQKRIKAPSIQIQSYCKLNSPNQLFKMASIQVLQTEKTNQENYQQSQNIVNNDSENIQGGSYSSQESIKQGEDSHIDEQFRQMLNQNELVLATAFGPSFQVRLDKISQENLQSVSIKSDEKYISEAIIDFDKENPKGKHEQDKNYDIIEKNTESNAKKQSLISIKQNSPQPVCIQKEIISQQIIELMRGEYNPSEQFNPNRECNQQLNCNSSQEQTNKQKVENIVCQQQQIEQQKPNRISGRLQLFQNIQNYSERQQNIIVSSRLLAKRIHDYDSLQPIINRLVSYHPSLSNRKQQLLDLILAFIDSLMLI